MSAFELLMLVVAIPIGLALVDLAQGVSTALRRRTSIHVGWFTPLLVLIMLQVLAITWFQIFAYREQFEIGVFPLLIAMLLSCAMYVAISFAFPDEMPEGTDLDGWFMKHRLISLGLTTVLMVAVDTAIISGNKQRDWGPDFYLFLAAIVAPILLAIFARRRGWVIAGLILSNIPFLIAATGEAMMRN